MKHKHQLPSIDPDALAELAKQFPSVTARPEESAAPAPAQEAVSAPEAAPAAEPEAKPAPEPAPAPPPAERVVVVRGGGFTSFLAFLALLLAAGALAMPSLRPWVEQTLSANPVGRLLLGPPTAADRALDAMAELRKQLAAATLRLDAADARVQELQASLGILSHRVEDLAAPPGSGTGEASAAWVAATELRLRDLGATADRIGDLDGRLAETGSRLEAVAAGVAAVEAATAEAGRRAEQEAASLRAGLGAAEAALGSRLDALKNDDTALAARIDTMAQRADGIEERLDGRAGELATRLAAAEQGAAALAERIAAVEGARTAEAGRLAALEGALGDLQARFGEAERLARAAGAYARNGRLALALSQVLAATETHRPFSRTVNAAVALSDPADPVRVPLALMAKHAEAGVATVGELRDSFELILVPRLEELSGGWTDRLTSWFRTLVGSADPASAKDPTAEAVAKARDNLADDDLAGAVAAVERMTGPAVPLTSRWLAEARARLALASARDLLTVAIIDLLAKE